MNSDRHTAVAIGVGANTPDAATRVGEAIEYLSSLLENPACSTIYSTPALGRQPQPDYHNAVVRGTTRLSAEALTDMLKEYEAQAGRVKGGPVVIDLDLVIYDDKVMRRRDFDAEYFAIGWQQVMNRTHL